uniref:Uncharacterized protein n=1 Tax=viral metagenome TaxID=1070528 RepID=A0A6M3KZP8_9ZZZZ
MVQRDIRGRCTEMRKQIEKLLEDNKDLSIKTRSKILEEFFYAVFKKNLPDILIKLDKIRS